MRGDHTILAFNRGMISRLGMARVDLKRYPMSAQVQTNYMPRVLGAAMLRPGLGHNFATRSNSQARLVPFVFSSSDVAMLEMTNLMMRVAVGDAIVTRPAVTAAIVNGTFSGSLASWTDADEAGATSVWVTGNYMGLTGTGTNAAIRRQAVTVNEAGTVHALRITVARGPVTIRVGTAAGLSDYFEVSMNTGTYSLAFTPTGNISIDLLTRSTYQCLVTSIAVESAGALELPTPWPTASLRSIRTDQSGDVIYVACDGYQQRRIERLGTTSWGVALYQPTDGPYMAENTGPITITAGALTGNTTLTASASLFRSTHVGALFTLSSVGQLVSTSFTGVSSGSSIRITGVGDTRAFSLSLSGLSGTGNTVVLDRSYDNTSWTAVPSKSWTADTAEGYTDGLDNAEVYYRLRCTVYAAGTTIGSLQTSIGSIRGVGLVTGFTSATVVSVAVLETFGTATATDTWREGRWSDYRGWPSAVALYEGRLWWAGKDRWFGSVSDDFGNFDPDYEGDAGPIVRSIGSGPVDVINWLLPLQRLMAGTDGSVIAGRSTSFDEPLTPSNFNPKTVVTQGCADVAAVKVDDTAMYVQRGGYRLMGMSPSLEQNSNYATDDLSIMVPEIGKPGIVSIDVQRQPDTRVHCVRSDGKVAVMVYDKVEDVKCWVLVETDGEVEDVAVLPGDDGEDDVYYVVKRTINASTVRYVEKWAREDEAIGATMNKQADSFITYSQAASATIGGLTHLVGESVTVWDDGICLADADGNIATFVVNGSGQITVTNGGVAYLATAGCVGLTYEARFQGTKLAFVTQPGLSGLADRKRVHSLALVLADTHPKGIQYGRDFTTMDDLPMQEAYTDVDPDAVWENYNYEAFSLPGEWGVDERLCLKSQAPRPCTLLAAIAGMNSNATG
jgi:hypothetical protein